MMSMSPIESVPALRRAWDRSLRPGSVPGLVAFLLAALLMAGQSAPASARGEVFISISAPAPKALTLAKGQSLTVTTKESVVELVVGDSDIADITPLTDRSFYVIGREFGRTNIVAYDERRRVIGVLDVEVTADVEDLRRSLQTLLPGANLRVRSVNGQLHLSGSVPDAVMAERAVQIAREYGANNIINAINVFGSQQVLLEVRFVETSRTAGRELGVSWAASGKRQTSVTGAINFPEPNSNVITFDGNLASGAEPFGTMFARLLNTGVSVDVLIQALEQRGMARRLAEPNLVALSGQTASFLAGGEVPVPTQQKGGEVAVEFKEYGIQLRFTPVVLEQGLINLRLEPEVSQVDFSTMVRTGGVDVPGFTSRRTSTVIELRDGQSFAIAGLYQTVDSRRQSQLPWIGNIPVLGALFRSQSFQREETDLVIIVTPRLVRPSDPGTVLATPHDMTRPSNDAELFLMGQQEIGPSGLKRFLETSGDLGPHGHILPVARQK